MSDRPIDRAIQGSAMCTHGRQNGAVCLVCDDITQEQDLLTALDFARTTGDKIVLLKQYRATPRPVVTEAMVEARDEVDGAQDAFMERVRLHYSTAPECLEARKHSFSRQRDMAWTLAMRERLAAVRSATLAEVRRVVAERVEDEDKGNTHDEWWARGFNDARRDILAALDRLEATDGPS